ncbi:hypothetical protein [Salimicrobium halophilum]|uniref:Uncharacterized protein n=1 Tax=Salimicrobium halophilum TaxID=86666 RepID=A0A1G8TXX7_9BACI|nr:hypothetical protein [Salimicrobium halophilum]SDJ46254.1 hypothetical protein SAMN04490247_2027 [Salimicrobium halophilum]
MTLLFTKGRELMEEDFKKSVAQNAETQKSDNKSKTKSGKLFNKQSKKK